MKKTKNVMLALVIGLGISGFLSGVVMAGPGASGCEQLRKSCQAGDQESCMLYKHHCLPWE